MEAALAERAVDVIGIARPLCTEPDLATKLLGGRSESGRVDERTLRLGGGWLGPSSSNAMVRALNAQGQTAWFYRQLLLLAAGAEPDFSVSALSALVGHFVREGSLSRARRKAIEGRPRLAAAH